MNLNWTLLGQSITFHRVRLCLLEVHLATAAVNAMRERQQTIADGLASAERASKDLALAQERATDQLREPKRRLLH